MSLSKELQEFIFVNYEINVSESDLEQWLKTQIPFLGEFYTELVAPWNIYSPIAKIAHPLLKSMCDAKLTSFPIGFTEEGWKETLQKMEFAMKQVLNDQYNEFDTIREGLELFGKYFRGLWD